MKAAKRLVLLPTTTALAVGGSFTGSPAVAAAPLLTSNPTSSGGLMSASRRVLRLLTAMAVAVLLSVTGIGVAAPASATTVTASRTISVRSAGFYAGGVWDIYQSNAFLTVNLTQDGGGNLYGSAVQGDMVGTLLNGAVDGQNIYFTISWSNGAVGRYTGVRGADGRLSGTTFDLNNPASQATWVTSRTF
ncbi:hypothetical protein ACWDBD_47550 [Streptomyces sp. NPDC001118]|uniref:hypothetical protein n=1 Tax=unclassified Streptomyces TaxID=2593676 RepID=UPI0033256806